MKILYVYSTDKTKDIVVTLRRLGYEVLEYREKQENSMLNDEKINRLIAEIQNKKITHLFSIHLIYNLAVAAHRAGIKYVSYIWDAPYIKLYTVFGKLDCCYYSVFDKLDYERFKGGGIPHVLYQPLAVNHLDYQKWDFKERLHGKYTDEISFVGSLYGDNFFDVMLGNLPVQMQNYFTSIFEEAAFHWDGNNYIYDKTGKEILEYLKLAAPDFAEKWSNPYDLEDVKVFEILYLVRKIANIERICILNILAEMFPVSFYTSTGTDTSMLQGVRVKPPVEPGFAVGKVYAGSKINLNISLKGIEGGTPQRVMDVMASGGFMLTNYCAETAELFEEDKEIVMFKTPEELVEKAAYYLSHEHEQEREAIAAAGQQKVWNCYTYEKKLKRLIEWVEET